MERWKNEKWEHGKLNRKMLEDKNEKWQPRPWKYKSLKRKLKVVYVNTKGFNHIGGREKVVAFMKKHDVDFLFMSEGGDTRSYLRTGFYTY